MSRGIWLGSWPQGGREEEERRERRNGKEGRHRCITERGGGEHEAVKAEGRGGQCLLQRCGRVGTPRQDAGGGDEARFDARKLPPPKMGGAVSAKKEQ